MKKPLFIFTIGILIFLLAACGGVSDSEIQKPENVDIVDKTETNGPEQVEQSVETDVTIEETVLLDESGVKITAKSLDVEGFFGPELKLLIENNSGLDLTIQSRNSSINGYMVDTMMSVDVANGKKANDELVFSDSDLETCGIEAISNIEFSFHIFNSGDWETYLDTEPIEIKTSIFDTYEQKYDDSGDLAYDSNGIKVIIKGLAEDSSILGPCIVVYVENNSENNITVQSRDVSINGFMVDPIFSADVMSGKRAVDTITFLSSEFEENEIEKIESLELYFHIFDAENWDTIVDTDIVSISF